MNATKNFISLKDVAIFMGGSTPSRIRPQYFGGNIPWVKTTDLNNGLIFKTEETLTELGLKESSCKLVPAGAVLVAMYGGFKQIGRTGLLMQESAVNQALTAIIPDSERLDPAFLLEWLNYRVKYWKRFAGSSRKDPNITKGDIADFPILTIPIEQQRSSAQMLSLWNRTIEKTERLVALRTKQRAWLLSQVTLLSKRQEKLGNFLRHVSRPVPIPTKCYWALGIRSHGKGTFQRFVEDPATVAMEELYQVKRNDLIVNITFAWEGAIASVKAEDERCLVSHRFPTYEVDCKLADPRFVKYILNRKAFFSQLTLISPGGAGRNRVLNKKDFLKLVVPLPPLNEQQRLATILEAMDQFVEKQTSLLIAVKSQKRGLMQKLLTGKWRLKLSESALT